MYVIQGLHWLHVTENWSNSGLNAQELVFHRSQDSWRSLFRTSAAESRVFVCFLALCCAILNVWVLSSWLQNGCSSSSHHFYIPGRRKTENQGHRHTPAKSALFSPRSHTLDFCLHLAVQTRSPGHLWLSRVGKYFKLDTLPCCTKSALHYRNRTLREERTGVGGAVSMVSHSLEESGGG